MAFCHFFCIDNSFFVILRIGDTMDKETEFLEYIYQNAKMGIIGIDNIKEKIKDEDLLNTIKEQERDYYMICNKATNLLLDRDRTVKDVSGMSKMMTYIDAKLNTKEEPNNNTIAKMMIKGSNRGIIEIEEKLNNYKEIDKKIINLAKELLKIEKRNLDNLKKFL